MRSRTTVMVLLAGVGMAVGCASNAPQVFGSYYNDLAPKVAPTKGERVPQHLTVQLARPANVAVFLVVPGRGSTLLFPSDSNQSEYVEAGSHLVETSLARNPLSDTSRVVRRQPPTSGRPGVPGGRSRTGRDTLGGFGFNQSGYLLIYASQEPLPYSALAQRVSGVSIPIEDEDALNTVTKLIRESTHTTGPWAAYATSFPP